MNILHIVPWFPNPDNKIEGVFIAKHIKSLAPHCKNSILHVRPGKYSKSETNLNYEGNNLTRITVKPIINKWRIKEIYLAKNIRNFLKEFGSNFDLVNFYIAYPNAINIEKFKSEFKSIKFCISEQWSAYHENFNLAENNKGRLRIANIFKHNIPINVVSNALGQDIRKFSNQPELEYNIIPNIVDHTHFNFTAKVENEQFTFCSINSWSTLKNPILLIDAFHLLYKKSPNISLILAGSGQLDETILNHVNELGLTNQIKIKGRINKEEVASLLKSTNVYCQSSNYETFSAICAEALACGTPVIATNIGGLKDFVNPDNGILVDEMTPKNWSEQMNKIMEQYDAFNKEAIAEEIAQKYNATEVGNIFFKALSQDLNL
ncbi:glycosyltransferase [Crocinitomix catalasitica]|uniref:glycosyltransferase n=1 Tax=Crocinitomix catalasitica TaxID=184607 RepID=UPI000489585A|nr:glycosyltransferase [Crocinitomix catalasitica]